MTEGLYRCDSGGGWLGVLKLKQSTQVTLLCVLCCAVLCALVLRALLLCVPPHLQGIKAHPWYTKELPPFLQAALDDMAAEQVGT